MMMAGCAQNAPQKVAVDLAPLRCPPIARSDARALSQAAEPAPAGDVTKATAQLWIDRLHGQIRAMNKAGERAVWQYGRCRSDAAKRAG
jgi:hypothetical protein